MGVIQVSFRQQLCPDRLLGRMNATMRCTLWATIPVGSVLGGLLATAIGVRQTLWVCAVGVAVAPLWLLFSPLRTVRSLPADYTTDIAEIAVATSEPQ